MTGTIRTNTSKARTSHVKRERPQNRRATSVPAECDSWEQRQSAGRKQFSYTNAPHGRACHRSSSEFKRRDAAKSRRDRQRERTDKMASRWEMCDSEPHNPTSSSVVRKENTTELHLKLGSDRFHLKNTYTCDVGDEACLAKFSTVYGEWRVVSIDYFMDHPEDLKYDVDWAHISMGELMCVGHLPKDPNTEDICGNFVARFQSIATSDVAGTHGSIVAADAFVNRALGRQRVRPVSWMQGW